jgi:uncharacterized protein YecE (DUF72 family)
MLSNVVYNPSHLRQLRVLFLLFVREFLRVLPKRHKFAMELRDESWYTPEGFELLRRHNVALCIHDWREMPWPKELTADFTYIRFRRSGSRYGGSYPDSHLREWANRIRNWQPQLAEVRVYVYFNKDIAGHAIRNARSLREMLDRESPARAPRAA